MADRTYGLNIDGERVTLVEVVDGFAVSTVSVAAGSLADSLDAALAGVKQRRSDPAMRVALSVPSTLMRRIDVTAALASSRADFENAVFTALPANREASATAGAFYDTPALLGDTVSAGVAVIAPAQTVETVYREFGSRRVELVATPLALTGFDGIWFGVHHAVAEVSLVSQGRVLAYRQLRAGGLSALLPVLSDPNAPELGPARLLGVLTGTGPQDSMAAIEFGRYMRMLVAELSQTLDYWRRSGENVPTSGEVLAYGAGAAPQLTSTTIADAGLKPVVPEPLVRALSYLPAPSRSESLAAFCAALTAGLYMPQIAFVNPVEQTQVAATRRSYRRMMYTAAAGATAVALGLGVVKPVYEGWSASRAADTRLAAIRSEFDTKADLYHQGMDLRARQEIVDRETAETPAWSVAYRLLLGSVPPSALLDQITATADSTHVTATITATIKGGTYADLTNWLNELNNTPGVSQAWSTSFSTRDNTAVFSVSVELDSMEIDPASVPTISAAPAAKAPAPDDGPAGAPDATTPSEDPQAEGGN